MIFSWPYTFSYKVKFPNYMQYFYFVLLQRNSKANNFTLTTAIA